MGLESIIASGRTKEPVQLPVNMRLVSEDTKLLFNAIMLQNSYLKEIRDLLKHSQDKVLPVQVLGSVSTI